jgi:uncharacterized protein
LSGAAGRIPPLMELKSFSIGPRGQTIRGTLYVAGGPDRRRPAVVLLHGFTGHRIEADFMFVALGRALADSGLHAITFDFRGSGESDGTFDQMLVSRELDDVGRVLQWLPGRPGVDRSRIGLLGFSLGGLLACCAARNFPAVRALALLAPTTPQNLRRYAQQQSVGDKVVIGSHTLSADFFEDLSRLDPLSDLATIHRPALLVHGTADKAVPPRVGQQYQEVLRRAGRDSVI